MWEPDEFGQLVIPEGVALVPEDACRGLQELVRVTIPHSVKKIGAGAFMGCDNLATVTVASSPDPSVAHKYSGPPPCSPSSSMRTEGHNFNAIASSAISMPSSSHNDHDNCDKNQQGSKLVAIEGGFLKGAFQSCPKLTLASLTQLLRAPFLSVVGDCAFFGCAGLQGPLDLSKAVSLESIGSCAFRNCTGLSSTTFPDSLVCIQDRAFMGCTSLAGPLLLPASVESVGRGAFRNCRQLGASATSATCLLRCSIGSGCFDGCSSLTGVTLQGDWCKVIEEDCFRSCTSLAVVDLSASSATAIHKGAFQECTGLARLTLPSTIEHISGDRWRGAFQNCQKLARLQLPGSLREVGEFAFCGCTALAELECPTSVTAVKMFAYFGCSGLRRLTFRQPSSLEAIGADAFYGCKSLTHVVLPTSLRTIGASAFKGCAILAHVLAPDSVLETRNAVFGKCPLLTATGLVALSKVRLLRRHFWHPTMHAKWCFPDQQAWVCTVLLVELRLDRTRPHEQLLPVNHKL